MISWRFCQSDQTIQVNTQEGSEDLSVQEFIKDNPKGLLQIQTPNYKVYINLENIAWIVRNDNKETVVSEVVNADN